MRELFAAGCRLFFIDPAQWLTGMIARQGEMK